MDRGSIPRISTEGWDAAHILCMASQQTQSLIAAAARLGVRIRPQEVIGGIALSTALWGSVLRKTHYSVDVREIGHALGGRSFGEAPLVLDAKGTLRIVQALNRFEQDCDRYRRISRGQFTGPMSGSEAARYLRGRRGRL